ncbi:hypothetical protein KVT40_007143 [Elsinoe batatas]|uniref:Uncharacterized protein n=1 Tax=Elsinoe batatas TaxID=2601811 RepID=A0A8K0KXL0_9PEZI|nr:hypothetical protein KVT40_007143 [Elsinoe batatas]
MAAEKIAPPRRRGTSLLRKVSTLSILPAIPLLILHSALIKSPRIILAVVPLLISTVSGFIVLRKARRLALQLATNDSSPPPSDIKKAKKRILLLFIADLAIATVYAILLVYIHVNALRSRSTSMLTAYACMPLWVNLFAHSLIVMRTLCKVIVGCAKRKHIRKLQNREWQGSKCRNARVDLCSAGETAETTTSGEGSEKDVLLTPSTTVDDAGEEARPVAA